MMFSQKALVALLAVLGYGGISIAGAAPTSLRPAVSDYPHFNQCTETDFFSTGTMKDLTGKAVEAHTQIMIAKRVDVTPDAYHLHSKKFYRGGRDDIIRQSVPLGNPIDGTAILSVC